MAAEVVELAFWKRFSRSDPAAVIKKHAPRVADRRLYAPDRWESLKALADLGTVESVEALLKRFAFQVDPTIGDQEEKEVVYDAVVRAGAVALPPLRAFLRQSKAVAWPLKCLDKLLTADELTLEILEVLADMDTEYDRDPQRKIELLAALEERRHLDVARVAMRFFSDTNESVRFHAIGATLAQSPLGDRSPNEAELCVALTAAYDREESVRIRRRILDAMSARNWGFELSIVKARSLPAGYRLDAKGVPQRHG